MTQPDGPNLTQFQQKLAERRAREEAEAKTKEEEFQFDSDLVPEREYDRSETDIEIDNALEGIDIIDAYKRWCGKMIPVVRGDQREGIKISCPIPGHIDSDPSAWINLDKQTWFCGGCQEGGDKYDIAAYRMGFPVPEYKEGADFHRLREKMAADFGYTITKLAGGVVSVIPPVEESDPKATVAEPPTAEVVLIYDNDLDQPMETPSLDWRPVCPEDTFLHEYMKATIIDDVPEEYHFFHALMALGLALGKDVTLYDAVPVYGNLFVCTLGRSGTGKSKARKHLDTLLYTALPYDRKTVPSKGVLRVNAPGSAESLIYQFMAPVEDPTNPKRILYYAPVRGLIDFNELSSLIGRTNRMGSVMKPTLMQFYDMDGVIQTTSMTTGSKEAHNAFASCLTTSQPKALRDLIGTSDDASGFLNRWLFIPGKEKERFAVGGVRVDTSRAVLPLQRIQGWASTFGNDQILWSEEAVITWSKFFHDVLEPERKRSENDLLVRIDLTLKKLMLLFAANRMERTLSEQSVLDALYCYKFLKASYGIPEAQIGNSLNNEISEAVLSVIKKRHDKNQLASMRDILKALHRRKYDNKKLKEAIDTLVALEMIQVEKSKPGTVGRPTVRYRYVG